MCKKISTIQTKDLYTKGMKCLDPAKDKRCMDFFVWMWITEQNANPATKGLHA